MGDGGLALGLVLVGVQLVQVVEVGLALAVLLVAHGVGDID